MTCFLQLIKNQSHLINEGWFHYKQIATGLRALNREDFRVDRVSLIFHIIWLLVISESVLFHFRHCQWANKIADAEIHRKSMPGEKK